MDYAKRESRPRLNTLSEGRQRRQVLKGLDDDPWGTSHAGFWTVAVQTE
jgi:hypothetical protein